MVLQNIYVLLLWIYYKYGSFIPIKCEYGDKQVDAASITDYYTGIKCWENLPIISEGSLFL